MNIDRRDLLKLTGAAAASAALPHGAFAGPTGKKPNVIFILADDLGYTELGCYGQQKIRTPNVDRLAAEGMRFIQHYSGSCVCAPTRCTLMTGLHTGHSYIRDNGEVKPEGQRPIPADTVTLPKLLQQAGYATCATGKWGLGGPDTEGEPNRQGFDRWFGYLCQRHAHNYYPTYLWRDRQRVELEGNTAGLTGKQYAPDLMTEEALDFIRRNKDRPFFLYYATTVPHVALQVPEDSLKEYQNAWPETPYTGDKGYLPHPTPRAAYAAMVTRLDRQVGRILALVKELGLEENTLVMFSSDNGPTFNGGSDSAFFHSADSLRGLKCDLWEGGIRVPMIARWPGKIKAGTTTDHVSALWDVLPTVTDAAGIEAPKGIDGVSFLPTLLGRDGQRTHDWLYWEFSAKGGWQAVRMGDWKGLRSGTRRKPDPPIELYNLKDDIGETKDLAAEHPEIVAKIRRIMTEERTESPFWPILTPLPPAPAKAKKAPAKTRDSAPPA